MEGPAERHDPRIGMLIQDRYRIVRKLGEGGMGAVYEAKHELIGRRLALKCLHAHYIHDAETVERFHREAKAATAIGHEHIIEVTDMGQFPDGSPYIVLEYLQGVELAEIMRRDGALPVRRIAHIAVQVCGALQAAHDKGIIHRDLKPENIFLIPRHGDDDFVKVLDFGISKMKESAEKTQRSLTQSGTALGTPYYMAPEQARALPDVDHRADIYALGVILYEASSATLPFDAESYPALMVKILTDDPPPLRARRPDLPPHFEGIVMRAMAKDREQRFQSMDELTHALRPYVTGQPVPSLGATRPVAAPPASASSHPPSSVPGPPMRSPTRRALALGVGFVVAVVAAAAVWTSGALDSATPAPDVNAVSPAAPQPPPDSDAPEEPSPERTETTSPSSAQAPEEVRVQIKAHPEDARIYIDGIEFPNPMDAHRPRSLEPVHIRVERRGYRGIEQLAIFDRDRSFSYRLERGRGTREIPREGATRSKDKPSQTKTKTKTKPRRRKAQAERGGTGERGSQPADPAAAPAAEVKDEDDATSTSSSNDNEKAAAEAPPSDDGTYKGPTGKIRDEF